MKKSEEIREEARRRDKKQEYARRDKTSQEVAKESLDEARRHQKNMTESWNC